MMVPLSAQRVDVPAIAKRPFAEGYVAASPQNCEIPGLIASFYLVELSVHNLSVFTA